MKNENTIASKTMTITLYNYDNKPMQFELPLENLAYVEIEVLSGDASLLQGWSSFKVRLSQ